MVENKYNAVIPEEDFEKYLIVLKNKVYKLLPLKEENLDWDKYLNSILIEVSGFSSLFEDRVRLISLMSKLEGLNSLEDFMLYRRTVFECLNLLEAIR